MVIATVRGPAWFFGIDSLFEGFAVLALLLVTLFSLKAYRFTRDRRYRTFAIAFGLMTVSLFARALSDLLVYLQVNVMPVVLVGGYVLYMAATLVSLVILFALTLKTRESAPFIALLLVSFVLVLLSSSYRLSFHSISLILLVFIVYHFLMNYFKKKSFTALLVSLSFVLLALTHAAFIVDLLRMKFYVVGHLLHVFAFAALVAALVRVLQRR